MWWGESDACGSRSGRDAATPSAVSVIPVNIRNSDRVTFIHYNQECDPQAGEPSYGSSRC